MMQYVCTTTIQMLRPMPGYRRLNTSGVKSLWISIGQPTHVFSYWEGKQWRWDLEADRGPFAWEPVD
jgi:hypothetical protein